MQMARRTSHEVRGLKYNAESELRGAAEGRTSHEVRGLKLILIKA